MAKKSTPKAKQSTTKISDSDSVDKQVAGGCLCGAIRYQVQGTPSSISICHCQSCRRASGAPAVSWFVISRPQFKLLSGNPADYQSSPQVRRGFCGKCGTQLSYARALAPDTIELTTASLDQPSAMEPTKESWLSDKLPWVAVNQDLEHDLKDSDATIQDHKPGVLRNSFQPAERHTIIPRIMAVDAELLVEFVEAGICRERRLSPSGACGTSSSATPSTS